MARTILEFQRWTNLFIFTRTASSIRNILYGYRHTGLKSCTGVSVFDLRWRVYESRLAINRDLWHTFVTLHQMNPSQIPMRRGTSLGPGGNSTHFLSETAAKRSPLFFSVSRGPLMWEKITRITRTDDPIFLLRRWNFMFRRVFSLSRFDIFKLQTLMFLREWAFIAPMRETRSTRGND